MRKSAWSDRNLEIDVYGCRGSGEDALGIVREIIRDPGSVWEHKNLSEKGQHSLRMDKFLITNATRGEQVLILVKRGIGESIVDALRKAEILSRNKGQGIPVEIYAAITIAMESFDRNPAEVCKLPAVFAQIVKAGTVKAGSNKRAALKELDVDKYLDGLVANKKLSQIEAGAVDAAEFWRRLSSSLWAPRIRSKIAKETFDQKTIAALSQLGRIWVDINNGLAVSISGSRYWIDAKASIYDWMQIMEWEGGHIQRNTLRYMTGYKSDLPNNEGLASIRTGFGDSPIGDREGAIISMRLLEDAYKKATCDPWGSFRVELPEFIFLHTLGITSLRVWIIGNDGMWIGFEQGELPIVSFKWTVERPHFQRWVVPLDMIPTLHITLSALWRDLKVGGRKVMINNGGERIEDAPEDPEISRVKFFGKIQWGSEEELAHLMKEIYRVRGHVRKLPWGKRATWRARKQAREAGVRLKQGTTYVRSHIKGMIGKEDFDIPVHARGLGQLVITEMGI